MIQSPVANDLARGILGYVLELQRILSMISKDHSTIEHDEEVALLAVDNVSCLFDHDRELWDQLLEVFKRAPSIAQALEQWLVR